MPENAQNSPSAPSNSASPQGEAQGSPQNSPGTLPGVPIAPTSATAPSTGVNEPGPVVGEALGRFPGIEQTTTGQPGFDIPPLPSPLVDPNAIPELPGALAPSEPRQRPTAKPYQPPKHPSVTWAEGNFYVGVTSSNVDSIRYDKQAKKLHVRFKSGGGGSYSGVDVYMAMGMLNSSSKGKWVYHVLRNGGKDNRYPYQRGDI